MVTVTMMAIAAGRQGFGAMRRGDVLARAMYSSRPVPLSETDASLSLAEKACLYIEARVRRASGHRWLQGPLAPALALPEDGAPPVVRLFAEQRLHRVPSPVARSLVAWARGERRVDLLFHVPTPRDVLALQARGRRCVSLLEDGIPTAPHA